ncbi:MAG: hypothetical protein VX016_10955 [Verrucomicrobiota bacterium]|nr:hypothetical protein [Verrucomicrobiota bacterium]
MEETEQIGLLRQLLSLPFDIFSIKDAEFVQGRPTEYLTGFMWSIKETDLNPGFSLDPIDQIMVAEAVLGAPGLVYSPHQEGMLVDVKRFQAGEEVICPHSGLKFLVPDNVQPTLNIGDAMSPVAAVNAENTEQKILPIEEETQKNAEKPVIEGQTAKRVIGKENLVYSPYTNGSYVVDITGLMPGERARCPYTGRIFTIPNIGDISKGEEVKKKNIVDEAIASISDSIEYKVIESKDDTEIKAEQDKDKSIVPFARWSKRVGYVISPYGGQLIDVQGKSPGSVLRCPFSGNLFKLPKAED